MKHIITASVLLFSTTLMGFTPQGSKVHRGLLWEVPVPENVQVKLEPKYSFEKTCSLLEKQVENIRRYNSAERSLKNYEATRLTPKYMGLNEVFGLFSTAINPRGEFEFIYEDDKLKLPNDLLLRKSTSSHISLIIREFYQQPVSFSYAKDTLTEFSLSHGLKVEAPLVDYDPRSQEMILSTSSMDIACDILRGKIQLTTELISEVGPTTKHENILRNFYLKKMFTEVENISKNFKKAKVRAAHFGRRTGKIIEKEFPNHSDLQVETMISELIDIFFDANMNISSAFQVGSTHRFTMREQVTIPLEIKVGAK